MERHESLKLADEFLSEKIGLDKNAVLDHIRTEAVFNALYQVSRNLLAEIIEAAEPFNKFTDKSEKQFGKNMSGLHIMHPEINMGAFRRLRQATNLQDPTEVAFEDLLMRLDVKPKWIKEHQKQAAYELKARGYVDIGLASGDNPPFNARLTATGLKAKARLFGIMEDADVPST